MPSTASQHYRRLAANLSGGSRAALQELADGLTSALDRTAPVGRTGKLRYAVTRQTPIRGRSPEISIGLGPASFVGRFDRAPRRGLIRRFIRNYPHLAGRIRFFRRYHRNSAFAWWALSREGKRLLQGLRNQGMYGGGFAPYAAVEDASLSEWKRSAGRAGKLGSQYIRDAVRDWRATIPTAVHRLLRDAG